MFAPANNIFKAENTDLLTGMTLVAACVEMVQNFRTEEKCCDIWDEVVTEIDAHSSRTRRNNTLLQDWVVEKTTGDNEINEDEMRKLFYSTLDQVINEINVRFSHQNTKLYAAASAVQHENSNFLDVKMVQPLTDLANRTSVEAKFDVAKTYLIRSKSFDTQEVREIGLKEAGESRGFPILCMGIMEDVFQIEGKECEDQDRL